MPHPLPRRIAAVVFDVGNTLHHIDHAFIAATIVQHGFPVTEHDVAVAEYRAKAAVDEQFRARAAGSDPSSGALRRVDAGRRLSYFETILETLQIPSGAFASITAALHGKDQRQSLWRVMHPDTPEVLAALRRRCLTLAVVSNADGRVPAALAAGGIAEHFVAIVDSHLVGVEKPDARIFQIALDACAASPSEAIYVGDIYEIDIRGARNAGMTGVLLDPLGQYAAGGLSPHHGAQPAVGAAARVHTRREREPEGALSSQGLSTNIVGAAVPADMVPYTGRGSLGGPKIQGWNFAALASGNPTAHFLCHPPSGHRPVGGTGMHPRKRTRGELLLLQAALGSFD